MKLNEHAAVKILKTLTKDEIHSLKKFISSPYFNTNDNILKIFEELVKFYPKFGSEKLTKQNLHEKIFKEKVYNDSNLRWMMSVLHHLIENFLIQKNFDNDRYAKLRYLATENLANLRSESARKSLDEMKELLDEDKYKSYMYFFYKYLYYTNEGSYEVLFKKDQKKKDADANQLFFLKGLTAYINHFITGVAYDYLNIEISGGKYYKNGISEKISKIINELNFRKLSSLLKENDEDNLDVETDVKLLYLFVNKEDEKLYKDFAEFISKNENYFRKENMQGYYSKMISYCWLKILHGAGEKYYREELFRLIELFLERKYYKFQKVPGIQFTFFRIVILIGVSLGKIDFAKNFLKNYLKEVYQPHRENINNFASAVINFYDKKNEEALEYLSRMEVSFLSTDQKLLRVLLFLDMNYLTECENEIKSFKKFLATNYSLSESSKEGYKNFLYFASQILKIKKGRQEISLKELKKKLKEGKCVYYKSFLEFSLQNGCE
jgi:hypothetical protein